MARGFTLHPDFIDTSAEVCDLGLCQVRLQLDARFPWLILIPRLPDARDIDDLSLRDRAVLMEEIALGCGAVRAWAKARGRPADKLNVAALGNVTPQLHVHIVARRKDDQAWPDPVWGRGSPEPLDAQDVASAVEAIRTALGRGP